MATAFEKVQNQAQHEAKRGGKDQTLLLRYLDAKQRKALVLFRDSAELTAKDIAKLFNFKPRTAALLCQRWVESGFLEATNLAKKSRRYRLAPKYEDIISE